MIEDYNDKTTVDEHKCKKLLYVVTMTKIIITIIVLCFYTLLYFIQTHFH